MDGARFDGLTRAFASRRGLLSGVAATVAGLLGQIGRGEPASAATCKALGRACARNGECCSRRCTQPVGQDGQPGRGRERCVCRQTLKLPCGGRCCTPDQTCKRGRCVHHCRDRRINFDESDQDCGGDDCPKCPLGFECNVPRDCETGHCAPLVAFNDGKTRCAECTADAHCGNTTKPRCNTFGGGPGFGGICSECATDAHCLDEARPICEFGDCVQAECIGDQDCPEDQFCDQAGRCEAGEVCFDGLAICRPGTSCDCDLNTFPVTCSCVPDE